MGTSATAAPAVRAAFTHLIDYAGLFPPAKLDMAAALADYAACRQGPYAWMLGRFIVPASRIPELLAALPCGEPVPLSVIVDAGADPAPWLSRVQRIFDEAAALRANEPRVSIECLEIALPPLATLRDTYDAPIGQFAAALKQSSLRDVPAFVEVPRDNRWDSELGSALFALSRHRLGAKLRCGGVVPEAFPSTSDVATFICAAIQEHGVPMKATAGLHHPIRHLDKHLGVPMHGFLNVLTAAAFARAGMERSNVADIVACEDADRFHFSEHGLEWDGQHVHVEDLEATRAQAFISYGSCSFSEPTSDLQAMGAL